MSQQPFHCNTCDSDYKSQNELDTHNRSSHSTGGNQNRDQGQNQQNRDQGQNQQNRDKKPNQ